MTQRDKQIKVFGYGLPLILVVLGLRHGFKHQWDVWVGVFFALAVIFLVITLSNKALLIKIFDGWMKVMGVIGSLVTGIILISVYYVIFSPVALFLKLKGQDYMNRTWKGKETSYWIPKQQTAQEQQYFKQF